VRILHLTPEAPLWPDGSGGATRQYHLLRRLAELGHELTVVAPLPPGGLDLPGIRLVGAPRPASRLHETAGALRLQPSLAPRAAAMPVLAWQVSVFWARLRKLALAEIAQQRPDVVLVEHDNAAHWIGDLPADIPSVLTLHNLGPSYYASRADAAGGVAGLALRGEALRFRRHQERWLPRYRRLIAMSEQDAGRLGGFGVPVAVVPNGVAAREMRPLPPSAEPATLLFTGTLAHPPNAEGIAWFAERAWPQVLAARPGARLLIVGRDAGRRVRALGELEGVEFVGAVADMEPSFARATAVVAPLLSGGGTRLKILEAFARGRAVVSTSVGCEGLEVSSERDLLVADEPEPFASAVGRLLGDPALRERLAASGRALVEETYDWRVVGDRLAGVLEEVAA
jgi:polysaccharide biosynthesis protein PslH